MYAIICFKKDSIIEGYEVIRRETLPDIDSVYIELKHIKSGARHIHIANEDTENTFSVIFKTIPFDSSAMIGSRKPISGITSISCLS